MTALDKDVPVRFLDFSTLFFDLVNASLTETIARGNKNVVFSKPAKDIVQQYKKETAFSDFRIIIPVLFTFFHGIELWLKGAHYLKTGPSKKNAHHTLSHWLGLFKTEYPNQTILHAIFSEYIFPTSNCLVMQTFYKENDIKSSDQFFENLKYPYNKAHNKAFDYKDVRNLGSEGMVFFKQIIADIETITAETPNL